VFCVSVVTIYRWRREGRLKCGQVGRRLLIKRADRGCIGDFFGRGRWWVLARGDE
jgi:predicted site-specific integrase-resolvase